jgi:glycosyltransferase involved in cell wall biosynthesis
LKDLASSLHVADHVDFLGFVDDLQAYFQHCDIFTLPSKKEGFGIVYLEAMQYKKPVIAVNYGGPTDVILDGETGFLCEYDDEQCLADKIDLLFNDPTLSQKLGENGYQRLMDNFTYDHYRKNLKTVLLGS